MVLTLCLYLKQDNKWGFARDIALSLGYIALTQQDSVTAAIPGKSNFKLHLEVENLFTNFVNVLKMIRLQLKKMHFSKECVKQQVQ